MCVQRYDLLKANMSKYYVQKLSKLNGGNSIELDSHLAEALVKLKVVGVDSKSYLNSDFLFYMEPRSLITT